MNKVILDTSAFLALLNNEIGKDIVEPLLPYSIMSSVNISEVVSELHSKLSLPRTSVKVRALRGHPLDTAGLKVATFRAPP